MIEVHRNLKRSSSIIEPDIKEEQFKTETDRSQWSQCKVIVRVFLI